jgi:hypothetical protein
MVGATGGVNPPGSAFGESVDKDPHSSTAPERLRATKLSLSLAMGSKSASE